MIQFVENPRAVFIFISDLQSVDLIERVPVCIGGDGWRSRNGAMEKATKQLSQKMEEEGRREVTVPLAGRRRRRRGDHNMALWDMARQKVTPRAVLSWPALFKLIP